MLFNGQLNSYGIEKPDLGNGWDSRLSDIFDDSRYLTEGTYCHLKSIDLGFLPNICPASDDIFRCFRETSFENLKCLFLGNDPYPYSGYADGLAFSISNYQIYDNVKSRKSGYDGAALRAVLRRRREDEREVKAKNQNTTPHIRTPRSGDLKGWAGKGVLLLNRYLTVEEISRTTPVSKRTMYKNPWMWFTERVVNYIAQKKKNCVFIFLGDLWTDFLNDNDIEALGNGHHVIVLSHPSARKSSGDLFSESHVFFDVINYLYQDGVLTKQNDFTQLFPIP